MPLAGVTVFLDTDNDGMLNGGEQSVVTSGSGNYAFNSLPNGTYHARLANGHVLLAFVMGPKKRSVKFVPGDRVRLQLTPFDLSTGRILTE